MKYFTNIMILTALSFSQQIIAMDNAAIKQEAGIIADNALKDAQAAATRDINAEIPKSGGMTAGQGINFQGTDLPEKNFNASNIEESARSKAVDEKFEAGQIAKKGFLKVKDFAIKSSDSYLDRAKDAQKNPENYVNWLSGKYKDCRQEGGEDIIDNVYKTCDEYHEIRDNSCHIGRLVEVNAKHTYECHKEREVNTKKCSRNLKVWCEKKHDCDSGGIVLKGIESDMKWAYQYPILTLGTIADNYWRSGCGKFIRNTKFEVKNKAAIEEFRIVRVGYDDYLRVSINGMQLYNEPYGGNFLEIERSRVVKNEDERNQVRSASGLAKYSRGHQCELSRNNNIEVNIDLLPHLKEGMNELNIEVVVAGAGEGWVQIRTKQHCCIEQSAWEEVCP